MWGNWLATCARHSFTAIVFVTVRCTEDSNPLEFLSELSCNGRLMTTRKRSTISTRGLTRDKQQALVRQIIESYQATDGCPPLSAHWGGYDLGQTDWLKRFAEKIAANQNRRLEAWTTVTEKCDTSMVLELLYLSAFRKDATVDKSKDAYHALLREIDKLMPRYDKLLNDLLALSNKPSLAPAMPYIRASLNEVQKQLQSSRALLAKVRDANIDHGSYKRTAKDWYLFLLARTLIEATGRQHIEELAILIDAARSANNEQRFQSDVETIAKRVQRWKKYMNTQVINGKLMFRIGTMDEGPDNNDSNPIPF